MRVTCGAWLLLLASATALCYPAVLGHRSCVARVNPAMARLGKPTAVWDTDSTYVGPFLQKLDAIEPTLSYQGWQQDMVKIEESYIEGLVGLHRATSREASEAFCELRRKQERHDKVLRWLRELDELKATLNYEGGQDEAAKIEEELARDVVSRTYTPVWVMTKIEEELARDVVSRTYTPVWVMDKMRRKQQVHNRRLARPGWPVPPDEIEDEIDPL